MGYFTMLSCFSMIHSRDKTVCPVLQERVLTVTLVHCGQMAGMDGSRCHLLWK